MLAQYPTDFFPHAQRALKYQFNVFEFSVTSVAHTFLFTCFLGEREKEREREERVRESNIRDSPLPE
jgi:hypothetical protein